jgi:pimeloyl-ACP methyl ester carboxylesterase
MMRKSWRSDDVRNVRSPIRGTRVTELAPQRTQERDVPIVCVHGLAGSSRWWGSVARDLERLGPTHLLDLPRSLAPAELATWVTGSLPRSAMPVDLVGHSLGALIALQVAAAQPAAVRKLVLIAPPGMGAGRSLLRYGWPLMTSLTRSRPRLLWRLGADAVRAGPRNIARGSRYVAAADASGDAGAVRAPTLLIWGAKDRLVPSTFATQWVDVIPGARLHVIENASHVPMIESPAELLSVIGDFREEG